MTGAVHDKSGPLGLAGGSKVVAVIVAFLAQLLMAYVLAGTIGHMGQVTTRGGLITAAFIWGGFIATTIVVNYEFQRKPRVLALIDCGHWRRVLLIPRAIIGRMGAGEAATPHHC